MSDPEIPPLSWADKRICVGCTCATTNGDVGCPLHDGESIDKLRNELAAAQAESLKLHTALAASQAREVVMREAIGAAAPMCADLVAQCASMRTKYTEPSALDEKFGQDVAARLRAAIATPSTTDALREFCIKTYAEYQDNDYNEYTCALDAVLKGGG